MGSCAGGAGRVQPPNSPKKLVCVMPSTRNRRMRANSTPNDDVHLVDREGEFIVELSLGDEFDRCCQQVFCAQRSGLWRRQVLPAPFPAGPPAGQAVPHGGPALLPAGSDSFLPWWYPPAFFLPVYHRIVTEKTPPAKSGLMPPADPPPHPSAETDRAGTRYSARPGEGPAPGQRKHLR